MLTVIEVRNLKYTNNVNFIDMEVLFKEFSPIWFPFTASREEDAYSLFSNALKGEYGEIADYEEVIIIPTTVQSSKLKLALYNSGLLDQVESYVASADKVVQIEWDNALSFKRTSPLLAQICASVCITGEQLDKLFLAAIEYE